MQWDLALHPPPQPALPTPAPTTNPLQLQHKARVKGKAKKALGTEGKLCTEALMLFERLNSGKENTRMEKKCKKR